MSQIIPAKKAYEQLAAQKVTVTFSPNSIPNPSNTEGIEVNFTPDAIERPAILAADINFKLKNIKARRLHTIMEAFWKIS